jgi:hypothetical protein
MPISKQEILAEIKKVAAANEGDPPGARTFRAATGITESAWKGRYWARWGDALVEAGFAAKTLNSKIPDEHLLDQLTALIVELGSFPVMYEMDMQARNNRSFPTSQTFSERFGGMAGVATALLKHARKNGDSKLAALCEARIAQGDNKPAPRVSSSRKGESHKLGFVYLKYSPSLRLYKIGKANDADRRGAGIGILLPEDLVPKHQIKTDQPYILEKYWHGRFRHKKKQGEWFELNTADIEAFKRRREFMFSEFFP